MQLPLCACYTFGIGIWLAHINLTSREHNPRGRPASRQVVVRHSPAHWLFETGLTSAGCEYKFHFIPSLSIPNASRAEPQTLHDLMQNPISISVSRSRIVPAATATATGVVVCQLLAAQLLVRSLLACR